MPEPSPSTAGVAVVLVGDVAAAGEIADRLDVPAVPATDAVRTAGAAVVVGVATEPWPGFGAAHADARRVVAPTPYYAVESWHRHPAYLDRLAEAVTAARHRAGGDAHVLFTAPGRPAAEGDPAPEDVVFLRETAEAVSGLVGIARRSIAWTSGDLGPSSVAALTALAEAHGRTAVLRCSLDPLGRPDDVAGEARALGLAFTEASVARDALPAMVGAVVATVVAHEGLGGAR